jgi:hypothetical protein
VVNRGAGWGDTVWIRGNGQRGDNVLAVDPRKGLPLATQAAGHRTTGGSVTRGGMERCQQRGTRGGGVRARRSASRGGSRGGGGQCGRCGSHMLVPPLTL